MATLKNKNKRQAIRQDLYRKLETDGESLADTVKALRKILGMNQQEFAKMIGQSLSTLRKIEQCQGNVTLLSIERILGKFHLQLVVKRTLPPEKK